MKEQVSIDDNLPSPLPSPQESVKSPEETEFQCLHCLQSFSSQEILDDHVKTHSSVDKRTCPFCHKLLSNSSNLTVHIRLHTGEKPYKCSRCNSCFGTVKKRKAHMAKNNCSKYCCSICNQFFPHHRALNSHLRIHRREERKARKGVISETCEEKVDISTPVYSCRICLKSFQSYLALNSHMRLHKNLHRPVIGTKCPRCFMEFSNQSNLRKHLKKVKCTKRYRNSHAIPSLPANRSETQSSKLSNAEGKELGDLSQKGCAAAMGGDDITKTEEELLVDETEIDSRKNPRTRISNDMTTHREFNPQHCFKKMNAHRYRTMYPCPRCHKPFTKTKLAEHMRVHTGEKPYRCQYCDLKFAQKANLRRHESVHPKDKPYRCAHCKNHFASRRTLKRHNARQNCKYKYRNGDVLVSSRKQQKKKVIGDEAATVVKPAGREKLEERRDSGKAVENRLHKRSRTCVKCGKTFRTLFSYRSHLCEYTEDGRIYTCDYCPNRYFFKHHVRRHVLRAHSQMAAAATHGEFSCLYCSKIFHSKKGFSNHIRSHTAPRSFKCKDCVRTFATATLLRYHSARHSDKRPYSCEACGKKFKLPAYVRAHKKICRGPSTGE